METTLFFEKLRAGDTAGVAGCLQQDPGLAQAKNEQGVSAVLLACYLSRKEIRDLLLQHGAKLELHEAVAAGQLEKVKESIEKDNAAAEGFSPDGFPLVALAAAFGHEAVARYLHEMGADINTVATNGTGYTALTGAVASGHASIMKWLVERGANVNYRYGKGYSPLLTAAANGHLEIVKTLLAHGADLHARMDDGKNALNFAEERGHAAVAEYLRGLGLSATA